MIPRIIHHIWLGEDEMPAHFQALRQTWQEQNPEWMLRLWTERHLWPLKNRQAFAAATHEAMKASIVRYEVLLREGGVYVDCDMECLRPLDALVGSLDAFVAEREPGLVCNAIMGARPGHPLLAELVGRLPENVRLMEGRSITHRSGSVYVDGVLADWKAARQEQDNAGKASGQANFDVSVFGPEVFFPLPFEERYAEAERLSAIEAAGAYAIHYWEHSWVPQAKELRRKKEQTIRQRVERTGFSQKNHSV